jgi:hypothetical protein
MREQPLSLLLGLDTNGPFRHLYIMNDRNGTYLCTPLQSARPECHLQREEGRDGTQVAHSTLLLPASLPVTRRQHINRVRKGSYLT